VINSYDLITLFHKQRFRSVERGGELVVNHKEIH
jgi:hypothetical protein